MSETQFVLAILLVWDSVDEMTLWGSDHVLETECGFFQRILFLSLPPPFLLVLNIVCCGERCYCCHLAIANLRLEKFAQT